MSHRYCEPWDDSDVIFVVENEEFHCHYAILKFNSPVFRAMFSNAFQEEKGKPVDLPGKEKEAFTTFLDLMYPLAANYKTSIDRKGLLRVLEYSEEYQTDCVKVHIDHILFFSVYSARNVTLSLPVVMKDLQICEKFGLRETRRASYKRLLNLSVHGGLTNYDGTVFNELSADLKFNILTGFIGKCYAGGLLKGNADMIILLRSFSQYNKEV